MTHDYSRAQRTLELLDELERLGFDEAAFAILHFKIEGNSLKKHRDYCNDKVQKGDYLRSKHDCGTQQRLELVLSSHKRNPSTNFRELAEQAVDQVDFLPHDGTEGPRPRYRAPRQPS